MLIVSAMGGSASLYEGDSRLTQNPRAGHHAGAGPRPEAVQVGDLVLAADHEERVLEDCVRREVLIHCSFGFGGVPTQQAGQDFFVEFLLVEALHSLRVL